MEEMIFNLADTHLFFNDLEVRLPCDYTKTKGTQQNSAQIDLRKDLTFPIDFPQIIDLNKLHTTEATNLEPFHCFNMQFAKHFLGWPWLE